MSGEGNDNQREFPYLPDDRVVAVLRGPEPGGAEGVYRAFGETLRGLKTTFARILARHQLLTTTMIAVTSAFTVARGSRIFQPKLISWS